MKHLVENPEKGRALRSQPTQKYIALPQNKKGIVVTISTKASLAFNRLVEFVLRAIFIHNTPKKSYHGVIISYVF